MRGLDDDDRLEPPVPPGLAKLSAPLRALAEFLRVDDELIEVAAAGSAGEPPAEPSRTELARWVKGLPAADKDAYLLRFLAEEGDLLLRAELSKRFREATVPKGARPAPDAERRTVAQLLAARDALVEEKTRKAAERAARERARRDRDEGGDRGPARETAPVRVPLTGWALTPAMSIRSGAAEGPRLLVEYPGARRGRVRGVPPLFLMRSDELDGDKRRRPEPGSAPDSLRLLRADDRRCRPDDRRQGAGRRRHPPADHPHLLRLRRDLRRHLRQARAEERPPDQGADAPGAGRPPRRLHHRPGAREEDPLGRRGQPLQAGPGGRDRRPGAEGRRGRQEQRPADRPDRLRQDGAGADPRPAPARPVRHRRRHDADRGGLRRRGRREPDPQARHGGRLRHRRSPSGASSTSTRSTRSARPARTSRSPATSRARGSSRPS